MKSMRLFLMIGAGVLIFLAGCGGAKKASCSPGSLMEPELSSPAENTQQSLTPALTWSYPDATCSPDRYKIHLASGPFFRDELGGKADPLGSGGIWSPAIPLKPATFYEWQVTAISGGKEGPISFHGYFYTGPLCKAEDLIAPTLIEPVNGGSFYTATRNFRWEYSGGCIPERYKFQFLGTTSVFFEEKTDDARGQGVFHSDAVEPCQHAKWRVAAMVGTTVGPFSDPFEFVEYSGTLLGKICPSASPAPTRYAPSATPIDVGATVISARFVETGNCRAGPDTLYDILVVINAGDTVKAVGRNMDNTWLQLERPDGNGNCWAADSLLEISGDFSKLPVVIPPPLPTPPPPTPIPATGCYMYNQNNGVDCVSPCPPQAQPGGVCTP